MITRGESHKNDSFLPGLKFAFFFACSDADGDRSQAKAEKGVCSIKPEKSETKCHITYMTPLLIR